MRGEGRGEGEGERLTGKEDNVRSTGEHVCVEKEIYRERERERETETERERDRERERFENRWRK